MPRGFEVTCCCSLKWPSRPHVTWNCACTRQFRSRLELPTDRAQERLFAAPLFELPAAPEAEPLGDVVPKLVQHLEALLRQDAEVVVATDGSSDEDVGAMAIVTASADFACGDSAEDQSPFKFELLALFTLFRALVRVQGSGRVRVLTDCQAAQQAVANPEACCLGVSAREAADLFRLLQSSRLSVSLHWVPSHNKQQSWVPSSGLLAGECRALNDKADSAANACRVCRAVDDVMFLGDGEAIQVMHDWLTKGSDEEEGWKCSKLEHVGSEAVRYLGMEVRARRTQGKIQYHISQGGYIADLLRSYPQEAGKPTMIPATKELICDKEEEDHDKETREEPEEALVKSAQKVGGGTVMAYVQDSPGHRFCYSSCVHERGKETTSCLGPWKICHQVFGCYGGCWSHVWWRRATGAGLQR